MEQLRLDLQFFSGEKTEKATPKKREDTRKKGEVARSQEINTAILLFFMFVAFSAIGPFWKERFTNLFSRMFNEYINWDLTADHFHIILVELIIYILITIAPIFLVAIISGLGSNLIQFGFLFTSEPLQFKLERLNPISGAKRIFSVRAIVELVKSLLKLTIIGAVTFFVLWNRKDAIIMQSETNLDNALTFFGSTMTQMGLYASLALLVLATLDYTYQRFDHEKNIRMSKHEIKEEYRNIEGDPQIKAKIREKQRQMSMRRMMNDVPDADVVITNPTHYAIAIKYDESKSDAPYVVAKGADYLALKIREVAKKNKVMLVENQTLARALYSKVEVGKVIDESFYQTVAEVLAYVYQVEKRA